jgi:GNAT superfamily N-acetyltransferase
MSRVDGRYIVDDVPVNIERIYAPPSQLESLLVTARAEGVHALDRFLADWESGSNRFEEPGELLLAARIDSMLVGLCGLNVDPYSPGARIGRLRHLYVQPSARRSGVGSALVHAIVDYARFHFDVLQLRTDRADAREFYRALGFAAVSADEFVTHRRLLA